MAYGLIAHSSYFLFLLSLSMNRVIVYGYERLKMPPLLLYHKRREHEEKRREEKEKV